MNRRLVAVALAVVIAGGSVAALVGDPLASQPEPRTVDATAESPGELVLAALETPERRSYDVRYLAHRSPDESTRVVEVRVDRARHRVVATERGAPGEEPYAQRFLSECSAALRVGTEARVDNDDYGDYTDPFYTGVLEPSDLGATVVDRTDDRVVLRVTNTSAAVAIVSGESISGEWAREEGVRGNLTVAWNTEEGVLDRVEYVRSDRRNETHHETLRRTWEFREWGRVHVDRPGWAGYTHHEFLCDVTTFRT